jgi:hypothetical protein
MLADDRRRVAWRERLCNVTFEHDTTAGRLFDAGPTATGRMPAPATRARPGCLMPPDRARAGHG